MAAQNIISDMRSIAKNLDRLIEVGEPSPTYPNVCRVKVYKENREGTMSDSIGDLCSDAVRLREAHREALMRARCIMDEIMIVDNKIIEWGDRS